MLQAYKINDSNMIVSPFCPAPVYYTSLPTRHPPPPPTPDTSTHYPKQKYRESASFSRHLVNIVMCKSMKNVENK